MAQATDNFNRADNADLGTDWTAQTAFVLNLGNTGNPAANTARANASGDPAGEYNNTVTPGTSQFSQIVLTSDIDNVVDLGFGPAVYMATAADTCYAVVVNSNASGRFQLVRRNAGTQSVLGGYTGAAPAAGDTVRLEVTISGSDPALRVFINTVERITVTDTSASKLTSGRVGLFGFISNVVARVDDFVGGDLGTSDDLLIRYGSISLVDGSGLVTAFFETVAAGATPSGGNLLDYWRRIVQECD